MYIALVANIVLVALQNNDTYKEEMPTEATWL